MSMRSYGLGQYRKHTTLPISDPRIRTALMTNALQPHAALLAATFPEDDPWDILNTFSDTDTPRTHSILLYYIMQTTTGLRLYDDVHISTHTTYSQSLWCRFGKAKAFHPVYNLDTNTDPCYTLMVRGFTSLQLIAAFKPKMVVELVQDTVDISAAYVSAMSISERVRFFLHYNAYKPVPSATTLTEIPLVIMYAKVQLPPATMTVHYINTLFSSNTISVLPITLFLEFIEGVDDLVKLKRALSSYSSHNYIEVLIDTNEIPDVDSLSTSILDIDLVNKYCNKTDLLQMPVHVETVSSALMEESKEATIVSRKRDRESSSSSLSINKIHKPNPQLRTMLVKLILSRNLQHVFFEDPNYTQKTPEIVPIHLGNRFYDTLYTSGALNSKYVSEPAADSSMMPVVEPFPNVTDLRICLNFVECKDVPHHATTRKQLIENVTLLQDADKKKVSSTTLEQPKNIVFAAFQTRDERYEHRIKRTHHNGGLIWKPAATGLTKVALYGIKIANNMMLSTSQVDALDHINICAQIPVIHHIGHRVFLPNGKFQLFVDQTKTLMPIILSDTSPELKAALQVRTAILALDTGMGKTLTSLAAIAQEHLRLKHIHSTPEFLMRVLIVVPDTLLSYWYSEIKKHTNWPSANVLAMRSSTQVKTLYFEKDAVFDNAVAELPIIFLMCQTSMRSKHAPKNLAHTSFFHISVIDEVQTFNMNTKALQKLENWRNCIDFKLFTTATPSTRFSNIIRLSGLQSATQIHFPAVNCTVLLGRACCLVGKRPILVNALEIVRKPMFIEPTTFVRKCYRLLYNIHKKHLLMQNGRAVRTIIRNLERVSAGGQVNEDLVLQVITRLINRYTSSSGYRSQQHQHVTLMINPTVFKAASRLFTAKSDGCVVCICTFENPLALSCGHVICQLCFESLISLFPTCIKCPHCRAKIAVSSNGQVYTAKARWLVTTDYTSVSSSSLSTPSEEMIEHLITNQNAMRHMLNGDARHTNEASTDVTVLKSNKLIEILDVDFMPALVDQKNAKLVVFVNRDVPAANYRNLLQNEPYNLTVTTAGVFHVDKKMSVSNIQKFRRGEVDVLMLNFRYATGFDLCNASHLVLMDFDTRANTLVRASSRVTRIGQVHTKVVIYTLLLRGCLDAFVYINNNNGDINLFSRENIKKLQLVSQLEDADSPVRKLVRATEILIGQDIKIADQNYYSDLRELDLKLVSLRKKVIAYNELAEVNEDSVAVNVDSIAAEISDCMNRKKDTHQ